MTLPVNTPLIAFDDEWDEEDEYADAREDEYKHRQRVKGYRKARRERRELKAARKERESVQSV